jgi:chromosome segregation ATPase
MPNPHAEKDKEGNSHYHFHFQLGGTASSDAEAMMKSIAALSEQITAQSKLINKEFRMSDRTLQEIVDKVAAETAVDAGLSTLIAELLAKINAIQGLTPEQQAQINAIGDAVEANLATVAAAVAAGTAGLTPTTEPLPPVTEPVPPVESV